MLKSVRTVETIGEWILIILFPLLPLFFLPVTQDYYDFNKRMLLLAASIFLFVLWSARSLLTKNFTLTISPAGLAFAWLSLAGFLSLFLTSASKVEALMTPLGPLTFAALALVFSLGTVFLTPKGKTVLHWAVLSTTALLGLFAVYQFIGLGKTLFPNSFIADPVWTPVGSATTLVAILTIFIPLTLSDFISEIKHKNEIGAIISGIFLLIMVSGLVMTIAAIFPKLPAVLLPLPAAWQINLESFKSLPQALWGVGPGNYLAAFTAGRPASLNAGPLWAARFVVGPSLLFEITATLGLAGLAGLLLLMKSLLRLTFKTKTADFGLAASLILAILSIIFVPPTLSLIIIIASLLLLTEDRKAGPVSFQLKNKNRWFMAVPVALSLIALILFYPLVRAYAAELAYFRSLAAKSQNKGTDAYNNNLEAIKLNPKITGYHLGLSQTSLALASALINENTQASQGAALSGNSRALVTQLIQQAISEAKIGTILSPKSAVIWQNLAATYESLTRVAQGADQWTIAAYQQAIRLDPSNPILRVRLGGVYLTLNRLGEAVDQFLMATQLKPDYANAHYNLANIYRQQQKYLQAAIELTATKSLVQLGSDDDKKVTSELADVRRKLNKDELDFLNNQYNSSLGAAGGASDIVSPVTAPAINFQGLSPLPLETNPSSSPSGSN